MSSTNIEIEIPYRRSNLNHIKGLHACALATVSEYATGLLLANNLDASKFRLLLQSLNMQYHYQGKTSAFVRFNASEEWMQEQVLKPLTAADSIVITCEAQVIDVHKNQLSTCHTTWQIKNWEKVKLKI